MRVVRILLASIAIFGTALVMACAGAGPISTNSNSTKKSDTSSKNERASKKELSVTIIKLREEKSIHPPSRGQTVVCVDWRNDGNTPVRAVYATIRAFDRNKREIYSAPEYCIFAVSNDSGGVRPGESHIVTKGEGYILPKEISQKCDEVRVTITKVDDKGY